MERFSIEAIGVIRSEIKSREDAPLFYTEGAPNAFLEMLPAYIEIHERVISERRCEHESGKSFLTRKIVAKTLVSKPLLKCHWHGDREFGIGIHAFVEHFAKRVSVVAGDSLEKAHQP
jgi:hypothetical protein